MISNEIPVLLYCNDSNIILANKGGREVLGRIVVLVVQVGA